ncbi:MAG: sugar transferase [Planctomycetota bacterium]
MIRLFQQFIPKRKLLLIASEGFLLMTAVFFGTSLPFFATQPLGDADLTAILEGLLSAFTVAALCQVALSYNDLYDWRVSQNRSDLPTRLLHASGFSFIALAVLVFFFPALFRFPGLPDLSGQTWKLVVILMAAFVGLYYWRLGFHWFFFKWGAGEPIVILGSGRHARGLIKEIQDHPETGFEVAGYFGPRSDDPDLHVPWLGPAGELRQKAIDLRASRVIVALEDRRGAIPVDGLLSCRLAGMRVEEHTALLEKLHGKLDLDSIRPSYLIFSEGFRKSRLVLTAKRTADVLMSLTGLVVGAPVMVLVALAIRLESRGPILFRQRRVGLDGREFTCLKFRSMRHDAEDSSGPVWAGKTDDRVTRVGRVLRATRLDEWPQFWNILIGEMSFVGPRPERPFFVERLRSEIPYYAERLSVRPGLTGWAQINFPYGASIEDQREKLAYDLYYIKNISLLFDLTIMFKTVRVILFQEGAR